MRVSCLVVVALLACSGSGHDAPRTEPARRADLLAPHHASPPAPRATDVPPRPPSVLPAPARLVAIGDVHGDLDAFEAALRAAGAIDANARWIGGGLVVVQTGDMLDRGDQERAILDLVERLATEALAAGGRMLALNGNHEIMNAEGQFQYVTPGGYADFDSFAHDAPADDSVPARLRGRVLAFRPGGPYARVLATHDTIVLVGDTLFVHGGALARDLEGGLDAINDAARAFLLGDAPIASVLVAADGPLWYRGFARPDDPDLCARLGEALAVVHATRMVVGHTVQEHGINSACDERVWRIDVGLARLYGGPIEVLEITSEGVHVVRGER